jgi:hypothetical protein
MKYARHHKHAQQGPPATLAAPSYHRILVKHGLIAKTLPIPDAYKMFLKVGADPEVQKLRRKATTGNKMKNVPALYVATAMALEGMTKEELEALKLRMAKRRL